MVTDCGEPVCGDRMPAGDAGCAGSPGGCGSRGNDCCCCWCWAAIICCMSARCIGVIDRYTCCCWRSNSMRCCARYTSCDCTSTCGGGTTNGGGPPDSVTGMSTVRPTCGGGCSTGAGTTSGAGNGAAGTGRSTSMGFATGSTGATGRSTSGAVSTGAAATGRSTSIGSGPPVAKVASRGAASAATSSGPTCCFLRAAGAASVGGIGACAGRLPRRGLRAELRGAAAAAVVVVVVANDGPPGVQVLEAAATTHARHPHQGAAGQERGPLCTGPRGYCCTNTASRSAARTNRRPRFPRRSMVSLLRSRISTRSSLQSSRKLTTSSNACAAGVCPPGVVA